MINTMRLNDVLECYKRDFIAMQWKNEKYKWEAVKCFQDNWNIKSPDFADMLRRSLDKTFNLLTSYNNYPKTMIEHFANCAPEGVRAMFISLFDESLDVCDRINTFKNQSIVLREKHSTEAKQHYQHENAISTYLWLRYPDKHYIFKLGEIKAVANVLGSNLPFKKGAYADNIRNSILLYNALSFELSKDEELINLFKHQLDDDCYRDPELRTLAIDVAFYISRYYKPPDSEPSQGTWFPDDYTPGLSEDDWVHLLGDTDVFSITSLEIMKRMKDYGEQATCTQLSVKYGETANFYNSGSVALARRVTKKTGCPLMPRGEENSRYWPVLYVGRRADSGDDGKYIWKLRDELSSALDKIDLTHIELYVATPKYDKMTFLNEVYMSENRYDVLRSILGNKLNIILQGAPGVGKTFAAKRLAFSIMGEADESRIEFVQFHQSYSYEDFIMGYKPVEDGFELKHGLFYRFCQKAANHPDKSYFFIIDEINRGNLSKIFGELLMLIERDYRGQKAVLAYNGLPFSVPKNIYIIGMMNTADRSLAMIDYALRRRFSFFEMEPAFDSKGFSDYQKELNNDTLDKLISIVKDLNNEITADRALGKGFCIGHSYFCGQSACSDEWLKAVVNYEIIPMLGEYWFDDNTKFQRWVNNLHGVFND